MGTAQYSRVLTLERGLKILELIVERQSVTVTEVANYLGIQKSASHRFLTTLRSLGYADQDHKNNYYLTSRLSNLAQGIVPRVEVANIARTYLEELVRMTGETSNLGYWDGREITYLVQKTASRLIEGYTVGNRIPAYCSAQGKAALAFIPEEELDNYLETATLKAYTQYTITDPQKLREELKRVREEGCAVMAEEMTLGLVGVAAPVFNKNGYPRYTLSAAGLSFKLTDEHIDQIKISVKRIAGELSEHLASHQTMEEL